jgi:hypothetical protein
MSRVSWPFEPECKVSLGVAGSHPIKLLCWIAQPFDSHRCVIIGRAHVDVRALGGDNSTLDLTKWINCDEEMREAWQIEVFKDYRAKQERELEGGPDEG